MLLQDGPYPCSAQAFVNFKENSTIKLNIMRVKVYTITLIELGRNTNILLCLCLLFTLAKLIANIKVENVN